jgi:hypothetical protein
VVTKGLRDGDKKIATGATEFEESSRGFLGRNAQVFEKICTENASKRGGVSQPLTILRPREVDYYVDSGFSFDIGVDNRAPSTGERGKKLGVYEPLII